MRASCTAQTPVLHLLRINRSPNPSEGDARMATINRYDPFRDVLSLRDAMDHLFQKSYVRPNGWTAPAGVPVDLHETEHGYTLEVSLPGWKPEDVNITF